MGFIDLNEYEGNLKLFDEIMCLSGEWKKLSSQELEKRQSDVIFELNYKSGDYIYYVSQNGSGEHFLLRGERK